MDGVLIVMALELDLAAIGVGVGAGLGGCGGLLTGVTGFVTGTTVV
jgi:hypothetical protein